MKKTITNLEAFNLLSSINQFSLVNKETNLPVYPIPGKLSFALSRTSSKLRTEIEPAQEILKKLQAQEDEAIKLHAEGVKALPAGHPDSAKEALDAERDDKIEAIKVEREELLDEDFECELHAIKADFLEENLTDGIPPFLIESIELMIDDAA